MKWLLVAIIVGANACGDLLNTAGMRRHGEVHHLHPRAVLRLGLDLARNRHVVFGIFSSAIAFFALMALLSVANLSFAVPATAASYLVETLLAKYILRERIDWRRWAGAGLVACGVALLAL